MNIDPRNKKTTNEDYNQQCLKHTMCRLYKLSLGLAQVCSHVNYLLICLKLFVVDLLHGTSEPVPDVWIGNGRHDIHNLQ